MLLKPLPYPHADELVVLDHSAAGLNLQKHRRAPFLYFTYREDGRVFQDVALWTGDTESVTGARASPRRCRRSPSPTGCCRCSARRRRSAA